MSTMAPTLGSREIAKKNKASGQVKICTESIKRSPSPLLLDTMTSVGFNEVAVYFSEEEWRHLESWQKELYSNVMREIHSTLISLGYTIAHPDVLCRIRKDQDPYISSTEEERKSTCFPSTSTSVLSPDILCKIKYDEDARCTRKESPIDNGSTKCGSVLSPDILFRIKLDEDADCTNEENPLDNSSTKYKENASEKPPMCIQKSPTVNKSEPVPKEESLLSIVLKRANAGSFYMPSYKYLNNYKSSEYSKGIPRTAGKESFYASNLPNFQTPNSNDILSSFQANPAGGLQKTHGMDKPYRCNVCEKHFKTVGILNVHMKTHTGVRPYQCNECGKSFRDNWNLKVHQKIHTGETPYKCGICDKGFIQYATYMKHQRIHTGEKPYVCCYCDKSFTNSSNLVRHHRTHTGEKPYICMECGKSFSYNTSLIQHKRVHRVEPVENTSKSSSKK
ncbi:uncharacterized protein WCC33_011782 [Rhinophrynus dorsalis]